MVVANRFQSLYDLASREIRHVVSSKYLPRKQIHSYGLIVINQTTRECVLVQRRHSVEFLLIMFGKYSFTELIISLESITKEESSRILKVINNWQEFAHLFRELFDYGTDEDMLTAYQKLGNFRYVIEKKISLMTTFGTLEWTWPKGRPDNSESPESCAIREFIEEVECEELVGEFLNIKHRTVFETSNNKTLINTYWLYVVKDKFPLLDSDNPEVLKREWVSIDDLDRYIRH